jgi:hypothetical protein
MGKHMELAAFAPTQSRLRDYNVPSPPTRYHRYARTMARPPGGRMDRL